MGKDSNFNLVLKNGRVYDGTAGPWYRADVVVRDDTIVGVGSLGETNADLVIDCENTAVTPGFIDTHSHSDLMVFEDPSLSPKLLQGVTTELLGQDGIAAAPVKGERQKDWGRHLSGLLGNPDIEWNWSSFEEYLTALERIGPGPNLACLLPHGNLRLWVMGMEDRRPSRGELGGMISLLHEGFEAGAVGLSTGLIYPPCSYADEDELATLCREMTRYGGFLVVHLRSEDAELFEAVDEMVRVCEKSNAPLHISHLKAGGRAQFGKAGELLERLEAARQRGVEITFDQYPYTAGSTMLFAILPEWLQEGGPDRMIERLKDPSVRERILTEMASRTTSAAIDLTDIRVSSVGSDKNKHVEGKNLLELEEAMGRPLIDAVCDLLVEEDLNVSMILFMASEEDVRTILQHPFQIACTDGLLGGKPHPRLYGAFPRILGHYCRKLGILDLPEAIRKMTSAAASRLGLHDRGLLKPGMKADLVVFDPETIIDTSTYEDPRKHPKGIRHVFVNGKETVREGKMVGVRAGKVLRR
jgi:N-acyl-D-amino-acid deacylase